jgi:CRISPR/Cas system-associated exonuclease Cas4 (RecB family)
MELNTGRNSWESLDSLRNKFLSRRSKKIKIMKSKGLFKKSLFGLKKEKFKDCVFRDKIAEQVERGHENGCTVHNLHSSKSNSEHNTVRGHERSSVSSTMFGKLRSSLEKCEFRGEETRGWRVREHSPMDNHRLPAQDSLNTCLFSHGDTYKESHHRDR